MRVATIAALIVLVSVGLFFCGRARSNESFSAEAPAMDSIQQRWSQISVPGREHEFLRAFVGSWKVTGWALGSPPSDKLNIEGEERIEWMFDNRFLVHDYKGYAEPEGVRPHDNSFVVRGHVLTGYDTSRRLYCQIMFGNLVTAPGVFRGTRNEKGDTFLFCGEFYDVVTQVQGCPATIRYHITDKDEFTVEQYVFRNASETKCCEVRYKRK